MDAIEAIRTRRSVRSFEPRAVSRKLVSELIHDATCAPYTFVSLPEPWLFTVIEGYQRIAAYGDRAKAFARANRPQIKHYEWADWPDFSIFHGASTVIIICGRSGSPVAQSECDRAGQNLAISAHARGLGSCWVGSPLLWMRDAATRAELQIPDAFEPYAVFAIGHPSAQPPAPPPVGGRSIWIGNVDPVGP